MQHSKNKIRRINDNAALHSSDEQPGIQETLSCGEKYVIQ